MVKTNSHEKVLVHINVHEKMQLLLNTVRKAIKYTLLWKKHCPCYTLSFVFSSSGHHSDGVTPVVLEVSEGGFSYCWVTELQGGLTTFLTMVGHSSGVEAAGSWT